MRPRLPSSDETLRILASKRTRPARKAPPTAGRQLARTIKALDERFGQGPGALQARWREIVGDALARRSEPSKLVKARGSQPGVLEIRVDGPAATLIQHQSADILERVKLFLGPDAVGRLRIVQGRVKPQAVRPTAPPRRPNRNGPLDAAREAELAAGLKDAPESLKDALEKLGRAVLRDEERR
jgi:hypothetical protein